MAKDKHEQGEDANRMPHVYFGDFDTETFDWRKYSAGEVRDENNDEDIETPPEVVAMCGYSSKDLWPDEEGKTKAKTKAKAKAKTKV